MLILRVKLVCRSIVICFILCLFPMIMAAETGSSISTAISSMEQKYGDCTPIEWGEDLEGIVSRFETETMEIALTLDACGSRTGSGCDDKLISFLRQKGIKATLFINARWIKANPELFLELAGDPLFEIENHGWLHKPCSVNGRSVYGIEGTADIAELVKEVDMNGEGIEELTGRKPPFFRSGTAYYDEVAVKIIRDLGYIPAGYSVPGDAGATFSREKVKAALLSSKPGDIILCHMNHPESDTAEGIMDAVPILLERGYRFVHLEGHVTL